MKKPILLLVTLTILLAACSAAPTADIPSASPGPSAKATATPSATASPALDLTPDTPTLDTPTITPPPTIPTFTPTFDVRTIVTATPAPKAECPKEDPAVEINLEAFNPWGLYDELQLAFQRGGQILELLNKGLKTSALVAELEEKQFEYLYTDFTGDGVKDLLLKDLSRFHIFYCAAGSYKIFTEEKRFYDPYNLPNLKIMDLNKNGLPEIIVRDFVPGLLGQLIYMIDEWDGENFVDLTLEDPDWTIGINNVYPKELEIEIIDVNQDNLEELVFTSWGPWSEDPLARDGTMIYSWNGEHFVYNQGLSHFAEAQYRFQALQDGDRAVLSGQYARAIAFYQATIFSATLESWSPERQAYAKKFRHEQHPPTPPAPDSTEYPRLAAYAYYRMLILHTFLGETEAAQVKYATLQEKFPSDSPGHPYVELATDFWSAYQSSGLMYEACAAAIAYADAHPEILTPLGSDYHGAQSHKYTPADVCPFR